MTLNLTELESVIPEIQLAIRGGVFAGVESPDQWTCIISFASPDGGGVRKILFSRRPRLTRLNLLPAGHQVARVGGRRSIEAVKFVDALSHALSGAVAGPMRTRYSDRVVSLEMEPGKDNGSRGMNSKMTLLFECTGMHANMFLLDDRQIIRAVFGRSLSKKRSLEIGCRYEQPGETEGSKPVGRRVDVMRFVQSGVPVGQQISEMYDALDEIDDKKRELTGLGESLSMIIESRRKVAESVRRDIEEPIRPGRPDDLHDRLRERLGRIEDEVKELTTLLHGVKAGNVDVVDRARTLVAEHRAREEELESRRAARDEGHAGRQGGYQRRDDSAPRPPRREGGYQPREGGYQPREGGYKPREGGYQRRDDSAPRPPRREGGYQPREGGYKPREGGYQRRDDSAPRPPRREGGYQPREGGYQPREGGYKPREGGYQRRDDSAPRPPRREGGYQPREGGYQPREGGYKPREGGYQRRDDSAPRPPRREGGYQPREGGYKPREGGYQRRDDSAPRPPRREGGFQRRDDSAPRPPRRPASGGRNRRG